MASALLIVTAVVATCCLLPNGRLFVFATPPGRVACTQRWTGYAPLGIDAIDKDRGGCDMLQMPDSDLPTRVASPRLCLRRRGRSQNSSDFLSDWIRKQRAWWRDCTALPQLWGDELLLYNHYRGTTPYVIRHVYNRGFSVFPDCGSHGTRNSRKLFVDIGANIGVCTMMMLARPEVAQVVAFEPNPKNLYYLTRSVLANKGYVNKLSLYPFGLGDTNSSHSMYMQPGNPGNTVLDTPIFSFGKKFSARVMSNATIEPARAYTHSLDEVFVGVDGGTPYIHLMKMDAQGFEVKILRGAQHMLSVGAIRAIAFEVASDWLSKQGDTVAELFSLLRINGYDIYHNGNFVDYEDLLLLACSAITAYVVDFLAVHHIAPDPSREIICPM